MPDPFAGFGGVKGYSNFVRTGNTAGHTAHKPTASSHSKSKHTMYASKAIAIDADHSLSATSSDSSSSENDRYTTDFVRFRPR